MHELDEDTVRMGWMRMGDLSQMDLLAASKRFCDEQPALFAWLTPTASPSEVDEMVFQLALTVWQIVSQRQGGTARLIRRVDAELVAKLAAKRRTTIGDFLAGKQARAMQFADAVGALSATVDLPQWALLGHLTEAIIDFLESGEWTRADAEAAFTRLVVVLDALDRVVKS